MFVLTREWLFEHYGSKGAGQPFWTAKWLNDHGVNVQPGQAEAWKEWKHLVEYQPNCHDIVTRCLDMIGKTFESELEAHAKINYLRVPNHADAYNECCEEHKPKTILELGVGGDSAISTAQFLRHIEKMGEGKMLSVDLNPLGVTWTRYKNYEFWTFRQADSLVVLDEQVKAGARWDLVFLDTLPYYRHTLKEMDMACQITDHILLDDITMEAVEHDTEGGKNKAVLEWVPAHEDWERIDYLPPNRGRPCVGSVIKKEVSKTTLIRRGRYYDE